jgi:hypothetical protein
MCVTMKPRRNEEAQAHRGLSSYRKKNHCKRDFVFVCALSAAGLWFEFVMLYSRHRYRPCSITPSNPKWPVTYLYIYRTDLQPSRFCFFILFIIRAFQRMYQLVPFFFNLLKRWGFFCVPAGWTSINSTFCPHSTFMCFVYDLRTNSRFCPIQL